jgi:hypothetical protein
MNYACVDKTTSKVINNIEWDGESQLDSFIVENFTLVDWNQDTKGYPVSIGYIYDPDNNGFIFPKPEQNLSFIFNEEIWEWVHPVPYPNDGGDYTWSEENVQWVANELYIDLETELQKLLE